jgi:hypothetical protein
MKHTNAITRSAKGEDCLVRIPGYCNRNSETVVYAHLNGGGMGTKVHAIHGAYCCSDCHDVVDGRARSHYSRDALKLMLLEGMVRTQIKLLEMGLIKI